jgi:hypothetical protein
LTHCSVHGNRVQGMMDKCCLSHTTSNPIHFCLVGTMGLFLVPHTEWNLKGIMSQNPVTSCNFLIPFFHLFWHYSAKIKITCSVHMTRIITLFFVYFLNFIFIINRSKFRVCRYTSESQRTWPNLLLYSHPLPPVPCTALDL